MLQPVVRLLRPPALLAGGHGGLFEGVLESLDILHSLDLLHLLTSLGRSDHLPPLLRLPLSLPLVLLKYQDMSQSPTSPQYSI